MRGVSVQVVLVLGMGVLALATSCSRSPGGEVPRIAALGPRPIIVIDIDTLRADHLGCYGYQRRTSPNIDRFAAESLRFEWAFSQAPNTLPSQASILTGLYPTTHGAQSDKGGLPGAAVTLAEALKQQGYLTAAFVDGGYMSADFGFDHGFDLYDSSKGRGIKAIGPKVEKWLQQNSSEPFLLLIHTYDVHSPYRAPEPWRDMFTDGLELPSPGFEPDAQTLGAVRRSGWRGDSKRLATNDLEFAKARYDAGIRYVDDWVGRLLSSLSELELLERAIVVLVSDHGEEFQEHGSVLHEKLYAPVTRIPLLIRLPGARRARVVETLVEAVDLMPTLLELVGVEVPDGVQGRSLLPILNGETSEAPWAFGESPYFGGQRFVAKGDYRLHATPSKGRLELYNFREDPLELVDQADSRQEVVEGLQKRLEAWEVQVIDASFERPGDSPTDSETEAELKALGYVE